MRRHFYILTCLLLLGLYECRSQGNLFQYSSDAGASSDYKPPVYNQKNFSQYLPETKYTDFQALQQKYDLNKLDYKKSLNKAGFQKVARFDRVSYYNNPLYYRHHRQINNARTSFLQAEKSFGAIQKKYDPASSPFSNVEKIGKSQLAVLSNKLLKKKADSLKKATGLNAPLDPDVSKYQHISDQDLVQAVNAKFLSPAKGKESLSNAESKIGSENKKIQQEIDLTKTKLSPDHMEHLAATRSSLIKSKYLGKLDSIRNADLKKVGLKLQQKRISSQTFWAKIKKQESFLKKSYFEGIAGLQPGSFTIVQFSPAFATHLSKHISVGAGPNFSLRKTDKDFLTTTGLRTFVKTEFLKRQAYGQMEDQITPTINQDGAHFTQHNLLIGGGCLIPFLQPLSFNMCLLYKVYSSGHSPNDAGVSPWVFRIGISSIKLKDQK